MPQKGEGSILTPSKPDESDDIDDEELARLEAEIEETRKRKDNKKRSERVAPF